jgi:hypothetical protein
MDEREQGIATTLYSAMMESMHQSDRSAQAQKFRVGASDLGYCSERLRRFLAREVPDETDMLAAWIGTWLGEGLEQSVLGRWPGAMIQSEVEVRLRGDQGEYVIPGHPDIIHPDEDILLDAKTAFGLEFPRRNGFDDRQKKYQRHLYAYAAIEKGWLTPNCSVGNVWIDRSAQDKELHVRLEPFDPNVVDEATLWLDEVIYNWQHGTTAPKEPPREMCTACGFFADCRGGDTDVEGLLTAPEVLTALDVYQEGLAMEKKAKQLKAQAKDVLSGVEGTTGEYAVRWVKVGGTEVSYFRGGYEKLNITKMKPPAKKG